MLSDLIYILVPGDPVAKGRARSRIVTPRGGKPFVSHYTPPETANYENIVKSYAKQAMQGNAPSECSLEIMIKVNLDMPQAFSVKKAKEALNGDLKPMTRPDIDNYAKLALDALNGIVYKDDNLIYKLTAEKNYAIEPSLEIIITKFIPKTLL